MPRICMPHLGLRTSAASRSSAFTPLSPSRFSHTPPQTTLPTPLSLRSHTPSPLSSKAHPPPNPSIHLSAGTSSPSPRLSAIPARSLIAAAAVADMAKEASPIRVMVVSDLDNTMVDHADGESKSLSAFGEMWGREYSKDSLLVYSTGRSPTLYLQLKKEKPLRDPDVVICSVGTEILTGAELAPDKGWEELLNEGWDRGVVSEEASKFEKLRLQVDSEQRPHKVSFHLNKEDAEGVVGALEKRLKERGLKAKVIYSGGYDLDILPEGAGKGRALEYFLRKLRGEGRHPKKTLVCGDSGNDAELFTVKEDGVYGVIVGNAMEELVSWYKGQSEESKSHVFRASERCAAGIMQALEHFKFKEA